MSDAFAILGLPVKLDLDLDEAETAWRDLSREAHPDSTDGNADRAATIHEAWNQIKSPSGRLREWLGSHGVEIPRGANISEGMMNLFVEVGAVVNELDSLITEKKAATSVLAKALLTEREIGAQQKLQTMIQRLSEARGEVEERFPQIEADKDFSRALEVVSQLGFLEKWEAQCRERFVALATA